MCITLLATRLIIVIINFVTDDRWTCVVMLVWNAAFWAVYPSTQVCYLSAKTFTLLTVRTYHFWSPERWLIAGARQGIGPLAFINNAIRMANPFWHYSDCVCHPYGSKSGWSVPTPPPIHSARVYTGVQLHTIRFSYELLKYKHLHIKTCFIGPPKGDSQMILLSLFI